MRDIKKLGTWLGASVLILLLASISFADLGAIISVVLWYSLLILIPGFVWVLPLKQDFLETFLLSNIVGFAIGSALLILDTVRIPLNKITFLAIPLLSIILALVIWRKYYFPSKTT